MPISIVEAQGLAYWSVLALALAGIATSMYVVVGITPLAMFEIM